MLPVVVQVVLLELRITNGYVGPINGSYDSREASDCKEFPCSLGKFVTLGLVGVPVWVATKFHLGTCLTQPFSLCNDVCRWEDVFFSQLQMSCYRFLIQNLFISTFSNNYLILTDSVVCLESKLQPSLHGRPWIHPPPEYLYTFPIGPHSPGIAMRDWPVIT